MINHARRRFAVLAAALIALVLIPAAPAQAGNAQESLHSHQAQGVIASVAVTVTAADVLAATSTTARRGEGVIRITARVCGNANNWQSVAASNGIKAPVYLVLLGQRLLVSCTGGSASAPQQQAPAQASGRAQAIVNYALAQVGKPYVWGASGPRAFDCSGLVMRALAQAGISVPHQDAQILYSGKGWPVSRANLRPGDIVWPHLGHVQVYIGNGQVVHAAGRTRGVVKSSLYGFYTARRYV